VSAAHKWQCRITSHQSVIWSSSKCPLTLQILECHWLRNKCYFKDCIVSWQTKHHMMCSELSKNLCNLSDGNHIKDCMWNLRSVVLGWYTPVSSERDSQKGCRGHCRITSHQTFIWSPSRCPLTLQFLQCHWLRNNLTSRTAISCQTKHMSDLLRIIV